MSIRRIAAIFAVCVFFTLQAFAQESSWVRVSGGIAFPGMHTVSIGGVYLIGAK